MAADEARLQRRSRSAARLLLTIAGQHWVPFTAALIFSVASSFASLAQPWLMGRIVQTVTAHNSPAPATLVLLVAVLFGSAVLAASGQILLGQTGERAVLLERRNMVRKILHLPIKDVELFTAGDLSARVCTDASSIRAAISSGLIDLAGRTVLVVGCLVAMAVIDAQLLLLTIIVCAISLLMIIVASSRIVRYSKIAQDALGVASGRVVDAIKHLKTIRASGGEEEIYNEVAAKCETVREANVKSLKIESLVSALSSLALQGASLAVIGVGGLKVGSGQMRTSELVSFILYLFMMIPPLTMMFGAVSIVSGALGSIQRLDEISSLRGEESGSMVDADPRSGISNEENWGIDLEFDHVLFGYGQEPVLDGVSFRIPRGCRCAIVGASGAGKSTMLALIERFYVESSGELRVGGVPATKLHNESLRARIGYVEQGAEVLSGTLRHNLTIGNPSITDDRCWDALRQVRLESLARRTSLGLSALVGDGGVRLSGGESQRLALARALLREPEILLLDEPTAALDSVNEEAIQTAIDSVRPGTTVVTVAHRLATVINSELIVVVDEGQVLDFGTHEELLGRCARYRALAERQLLDRRATKRAASVG